ncbi:MAG: hypothetical protein WCO56_03100 [Verrucomicrobiota bacterium]
MSNSLNRRDFMRNTLGVSTLAAIGTATGAEPSAPPAAVKDLPQGKLGKLSVSRLIFGGNLMSGIGHGRDLLYVTDFLKKYFTEAKVYETWELCEANGINTLLLRPEEPILGWLKNYRSKQGGKCQWIAQAVLTEANLNTEIQKAADAGAAGIVVDGEAAEALLKAKKGAVLEKALELIRQKGMVAGLGAHQIQTVMASEEAGWKPDVYLKTFNSKRYWSATVEPRRDNIWDEKPSETANFMAEVNRPWIACKVLGAGAIRPDQGFVYAFESGADFLCVGMLDIQVGDDARILTQAYQKARGRTRPWCG